MPPPPAPSVRIALFLPDLDDRPGRRAAVDLAGRLLEAGLAVDAVAPMGGGALRAALDPAIGQIDLAKRHAATSVLALARVVAERRPAVLAVPREAAWIAKLAGRLARTGVAVVTLADDVSSDLSAIRAAAPRWG
ncbi:hypothetical protein [Azospirillum picis]|uniref:Uncharacterized protein n=1 Tax=Azospirillum picis TaxID=488438 RepID=A0ABU0MV36_9PROT|nr:hypothetical protein [Azospirillum picis]MBP2303453.1 hypothetical protein [Azospirillum picis]MDQ0537358.1 hypothetical protein [Azospirillum picis]